MAMLILAKNVTTTITFRETVVVPAVSMNFSGDLDMIKTKQELTQAMELMKASDH